MASPRTDAVKQTTMNACLLLAAMALRHPLTPPTASIAPSPAAQEAQDPQRRRGGGQPAGDQQTPPPGSQEAKKPEEKKDTYQDAIKDMAKKEGVFTVFSKGESYLFQVPKKLLGRDFLWTTELKETPTGMYNGTFIGSGVVRFELHEDKLFLRSIDYSVRATEGSEIKVAVEQSNVNPIIKSFPIKATAPDGSPLIDVASYFKGDIPEFSVKSRLGGSMIDSDRSYFNSIKVFPRNVNIEVTQTVTGGGGASAGGGRRGGGLFGGPPSRPSTTGVVLHSIVLLPEKPMMGRLADSRVGYFSTGFSDYGTNNLGVKDLAFIDRYRLEKKDPTAAVSEPKKQIVYYISREVPAKWRAYIKQGIEDWNPAFEEAGFKNAVVCKDAPSEKEDPNWDPEDVRYSVIRWAPLPVENAMGPHVSDPRSGEILSAHVIVWHDILKLQTHWYFAQASPNDPRAQKLPLPDDLVGQCLRFVIAHEVGHTFGLPHNGKSSGMIPCKLLRDPKWTTENGVCTSIMDYARFNYVAQPGDGAYLMPKVGRYDRFAIMWGYSPIPGVANPGDEKRTLDLWASRQVTDPMLRFYDNFSSSDPTAQMESLGDNTVEASTYGVANLKRVMSYLMNAATKFGDDYSDLADMYGAVTEQLMMYIMHVSAPIGGYVQTDYHAGRGGDVYSPCSKEYQKSAVKWLCDNILQTPTWMTPKDVMMRIGNNPAGNIGGLQNMALGSLMNEGRWARMLQNEASNGGQAYSVAQLLADVRGSVFRELVSGQAVTLDRRAVQRQFVQLLCNKLGASSESRAHAMVELSADLRVINGAIGTTRDSETAAHLVDMKKQIEFCLANPDKAAPATAQGASQLPFYRPWCTAGMGDWLPEMDGGQ